MGKPKRQGYTRARVRLTLRLPQRPFFRELLVQLFLLSYYPPLPPRPALSQSLLALGKTEGQVPSKRRYRRYVTMLGLQGISLVPQKTSCAVNPSDRLHRVKLLMVFAKDYFS